MSRGSLLIRLYPRRWRRRYEDEYLALLEAERWSPGLVLDVVRHAFAARLDPYPPGEVSVMSSRRLQGLSAIAALALVLPAAVLLASAFARAAQPAQYEPARTAAAVFEWFASLHAGDMILLAGPALALILGAAAVWGRLRSDQEARADLRLLGEVGLRVLRRPILVIGAAAMLVALAVLVFAIHHQIVG
jgi:hypothetical protein